MNKQPETIMIGLEHLRPSKTQPRKHFDEDKLAELTQSMKEHGFTLSTLLVRALGDNGFYEVVTGERRLRAAKAAGIQRAPCYVRAYNDSEVIAIQLVENLQREDLTPIEQAEGYSHALSLRNESTGEPIFTIAKLAKQTGKSERIIEQRLQLCRLPEEARREVDALRLAPSTAWLIARIPDEKLRLEATKVILHPKGDIGPLTREKAQIALHEKFIRDLRQAKFDQKDPELVPIYFDEKGERIGGGTCLDCPFRSGFAARETWNPRWQSSHSYRPGDYICQNPSCYRQKESKEMECWKIANTDVAKNRHATTEQESIKLFPVSNQLAQQFNLVDLNECPDSTELRPGVMSASTWKRLIGKDTKLKIIVTRDRLGTVHELVDRQGAILAARTNGHASLFKSTQRERPPDQEERKQQEKRRESETQIYKAAMIACVEEVRKKVNSTTIAAVLRLQMDRELEFSPAHADFLKRHSLPIASRVAKSVARWKLKDIVAWLVEFVIAEGGYSYDSLHERNRAWLDAFGVNFDKVLKTMKKETKR